MSVSITKIIGRFLIVYGFIVTALTISGIVEINQIKDIQQFAHAIFNTNCMLTINSVQTCQKVFTFTLALLLVSAILITIFYRTFSMIFASISLLMFSCFYCNPKIDLSFQNFIHFIQICIAVCGLVFLGLRQQIKQKP